MRTALRLASQEIALFWVQGGFYAIEDSCPHGGSSLAMGKLELR